MNTINNIHSAFNKRIIYFRFFLIVSVPVLAVVWILNENATQLLEASLWTPIFGLGGGPGGGGDSGRATSYSSTGKTEAMRDVSRGAFDAAMSAFGGKQTSNTAGYSSYEFADGTKTEWTGNNEGNSSTPFLTTWNGKSYEFENDFLFGKPNTAFNTYAEGSTAYKAGIGGDTYFIKNKVKAENGVLKFQIKEIEPEESFIDSFKLTAVDIPATHHPVVDGNLKDVYFFDTTKTTVMGKQKAILQENTGKEIPLFKNGYSKFGAVEKGKDLTLRAGDKITISLPVDGNVQDDVFLMVDSYFRDWTLGNQVPFTFADKIVMKTVLTVKMLPIWCVACVMSGFGLMAKNANADVPTYYKNNVSVTTNTGTGGTYGGNRSLVITARVGNEVAYLQTLFPRYVQASQEVVRIPATLLKKAIGSTIEVCITATKKHKVRSAFLFQGTPTDDAVYTPLTIASALKQSNQTEYSNSLTEKDGEFLRTLPSDVIDVMVQDVPLKEGYVRHYMLQAHGFYTKLSAQTKNKIGDYWYGRLDRDSKKLLKNLRAYKV